MIKNLAIGTLFILFSSISAVQGVTAQVSEEPNDTRIEKYEDLTETEVNTSDYEAEETDTAQSQDEIEEPATRTEEELEEYQSSEMDDVYDVRRTEAFNLVSSAYRGDFEDQGINSYAVLVANYEDGELTAEDLIDAAIEAGELSPSAMEDESYIEAVDLQLDSLVNN